MMNPFKRFFVAQLRRRGIALKDAQAEGWWPHKLRPLSNCTTIIDVGVWKGTPKLYAAFPDAYLLLIDPLAEAEPHMRRIVEQRTGVYETAAAGASDGTATLKVTADRSAATLHHRTTRTPGFTVERDQVVTMTTLDHIVIKHEPPPPYLIKVDTEGHELDVLEGATATLGLTDCVIAELSVADRFDDSYRLAEVITLLDTTGFALRDILSIKRDPDSRVRRFDAVFIRH